MRGGKRTGAGRKAGSPNKATAEQREAVAASGLTPLDYMLGLLRDVALPDETRFEAAKAAAPYVHAKLAAVEMSGNLNISHEDFLDGLGDEPDSETPPAKE